jgi:hypothetical protein
MRKFPVIKSTDGTKFELRPRVLRELDSEPYSMTREWVRVVLGVTSFTFFYRVNRETISGGGYHYRNKFLRLGCQKFRGDSYRQLRKWALNEA